MNRRSLAATNHLPGGTRDLSAGRPESGKAQIVRFGFMLSRRDLLSGLSGLCWISPDLVAAAQAPATTMSEHWAAWLGELRKMQAIARRRGWDQVPLEIDPPATEAAIRGIEISHGLTMPAQLREVLRLVSARVHFGWSIPPLLHPLEGLNLPTSGGLHDSLWSLDHINREAIVSFYRLRDRLADLGDGEEPNAPEMWNNQFPFAAVGEGDAPYQAQLQAAPYQIQMQRITAGVSDQTDAILNALVEAGADAGKRDGFGRSTLWYCGTVADANRLIGLGLDPMERGADGATLLHRLIEWHPIGFARNAAAVALFKYYQGLGLDINAADRDGTTVLHMAALRSGKEDIALLLTLGADTTVRDNGGRQPVDRVRRSNQEVRDLLRS